jgi:hypothetical protein
MLTLSSFLTPLENTVITAMLENSESGEVPRSQLALGRLESREHNGYGFFTTFSIPDEASLCSLIDERLLADAMVGGERCGFILWIKNGKVDFFEGYPLSGDAWPSNESFDQLVVYPK